MTVEPAPDFSELSGGTTGPVYNEAAFSYFLSVDRSRLRRLSRTIVLVLVSVRPHAGRSVPIDHGSAAALFTAVAGSVREVDFVGWYRHGRVIGAVLPQAGFASSEERRLIGNRIMTSLHASLPREAARHVHVRVVCLGGKVRQ